VSSGDRAGHLAQEQAQVHAFACVLFVRQAKASAGLDAPPHRTTHPIPHHQSTYNTELIPPLPHHCQKHSLSSSSTSTSSTRTTTSTTRRCCCRRTWPFCAPRNLISAAGSDNTSTLTTPQLLPNPPPLYAHTHTNKHTHSQTVPRNGLSQVQGLPQGRHGTTPPESPPRRAGGDRHPNLGKCARVKTTRHGCFDPKTFSRNGKRRRRRGRKQSKRRRK